MTPDQCEYVDRNGEPCYAVAVVTHLDPCFGNVAACAEHAERLAPCCDKLMECNHDWCDEHGRVTIVDGGSERGYAGPIYWATLSCGCQDVDLSADNAEAAR